MVKGFSIFAYIILVITISSCSPGQLFGPTLTATSTITPTPTSTPTNTPTLTPTPTETPSPTETPTNFSFSSTIDSKQLDKIYRRGEVSIYNGNNTQNLTEQIGFPTVGSVGDVIAYKLEKNESSTVLEVLFITGGGVIKARVDYVDIANTAWPQPQIYVNELDYKHAQELSTDFDQEMKKMSEGDLLAWGQGWLTLQAVNNNNEQEKCQTIFKGLSNVNQLCRFDPANPVSNPSQMYNQLVSHITPVTAKSFEQITNFSNYDTLSAQGNTHVTLQIP
jgi:hypothetical protein